MSSGERRIVNRLMDRLDIVIFTRGKLNLCTTPVFSHATDDPTALNASQGATNGTYGRCFLFNNFTIFVLNHQPKLFGAVGKKGVVNHVVLAIHRNGHFTFNRLILSNGNQLTRLQAKHRHDVIFRRFWSAPTSRQAE